MSNLSKVRFRLLIFIGIVTFSISAQEPNDSIIALADSISSDIILNKAIASVFSEEFSAEGATICTHFVERGETWGYLASISGMEEDELKALNGRYDALCSGQEILLPKFPVGSKRYEQGIVNGNPLFQIAIEHIQKGDLSKAIKTYNEILKTNESLTAYYKRGQVYLAKDKLGQAADDFSKVARNDKYGLFPDARSLANRASQLLAERRQARDEMWGNIIGEIVRTGVEVAYNYSQIKQAEAVSNNQSTRSVQSSGGTSSSYEDRSSSSNDQKTTRKCAYCNGTGRIVKEVTIATFGLDEKVKCDECGKTFWRSTGHMHVDCTHCHNGVPK